MRGSVGGFVVRREDGAPVADAAIEVVRGVGRAPDIAPTTNSVGWFVLDELPAGEWVLAATSGTGRGQAAVHVFDNAESEVTIEVIGAPRGAARPGGERTSKGTRQDFPLRGRVIRADTWEPVANAAIAVIRGPGGFGGPEPYVETDGAGHFVFPGLTDGEWVLSATSPAGTGEATVRVYSNTVSDVTIEVAETSPARRPSTGGARKAERPIPGSVRGRVVRADNASPVANATVTMVQGPGSSPESSVTTDGAGYFALTGLTEGEWVLSAMSSAGSGRAAVHVFNNAASNVTIEVAGSSRARRGSAASSMTKTERSMPGSVRGRVVRADNGRPLADATIGIVSGAGPAPDIAPLTNSAGWFALEGLPAGEWVLSALGPHGETGGASVRVSAGSVADVTITVAAPEPEAEGAR